ncbi:hypothetical protein BDR06DRAFT_975589 [Suillus hirtellus]|nr:hypothetical protein BDR06DRAFT_975589 [Suillus hirtellus]
MYHCDWPGYKGCSNDYKHLESFMHPIVGVFKTYKSMHWRTTSQYSSYYKLLHLIGPVGSNMATVQVISLPVPQRHIFILPGGLALHEAPTTNTINPVLIPLPHSDNMDLIHPTSIAEACGYILATKRAGVCHKAKAPRGKGKEKENAGYSDPKKHSQEDRDEDDEAEARVSLLDIVQDELPLGQCGWQTGQVKFGQWAKVKHWPECKLTLLETEFKQLVKTTKPTGDSMCPLEVTCTHHIK